MCGTCDCDCSVLTRCIEERWKRFVGRLTPTQRLIFVGLIALGIAVNCYYLWFVVTKCAYAASHPTSSESMESTPFPDFDVIVRQPGNVSTGVCMYSISRNDTVPKSLCPPSGVLTTVLPAVIDGRDGVQAISTNFSFFGSFWNNNPESIPVIVDLLILLPDNQTANQIDPYGLIQVTVKSRKDSIAGVRMLPIPLAVANGYVMQLSASVDVDVGGAIREHVFATTIDYPRRGVDTATTDVVLEFGNFFPLTPYELRWNRKYISYDWRDAVAGFFSILTTSITAIFVLFPMTAVTKHERMFLFDRDTLPLPLTAPQAPALAADERDQSSYHPISLPPAGAGIAAQPALLN